MVLMERMYSANPHFVRCIKPNSQKQPGVVDSHMLLQQVRKSSFLCTYFCQVSVGSGSEAGKEWKGGERQTLLKSSGAHWKLTGLTLPLQ